jgi:hypothetical protein
VLRRPKSASSLRQGVHSSDQNTRTNGCPARRAVMSARLCAVKIRRSCAFAVSTNHPIEAAATAATQARAFMVGARTS